MGKKILILCVTVTCGLAMFFIILSFASAQSKHANSDAYSDPVSSQVITPTILSVSPNVLRNSLQSKITILGENFEIWINDTGIITYPQALLNDNQLTVVGNVTTQVLTAEVSCGFDTQAYTLTMINPSGGIAQLAEAITITASPQVWTTGGPYGGYVDQIIISPDNPTTVYARAAEAGIFTSQDGGEHWRLIFPSDLPPTFQTFAVNTSNTDILYAGTLHGLYRSLDAGISWTKILTGYVDSVAYSPQPSYRLYAGIDFGIRTSIDDGDTWSDPGEGLPSLSYISIAIHPSTSTIAYASSRGPVGGGHIYKTTDGGATWSDLDMLPHDGDVYVFVDPQYPEHVYATSGFKGTTFHRSLDGGLTWEAMSIEAEDPLEDFAFDPLIPGVIYGMESCRGIYKSTDFGATWATLMFGLPDCATRVVLNPETGEPFMAGGMYLGFWKCDLPNGCDSDSEAWYPSSEGISALIPHSVAVADYVPWQAYTAAMDSGGFYSENGGQQWSQAVVTSTLGNTWLSTAVDPKNRCIAYLGGGGAPIARTLNCGKTWKALQFGTPPEIRHAILAIAVDPHNSNTILAGGLSFTLEKNEFLGFVFTSTDQGETWSEINFTQPISQVSSIIFDPQVTGTIYIATGGHFGDICCIGRVHKSIDSGITWQTYQDGLSGLPISALAIDPKDSNRLYAGLTLFGPDWSHPLYISENAGESWQPWGTGFEKVISITDIYINPLRTDEIYVSVIGFDGGQGVYRSLDRGNTWQHFDTDTINGNAYCLDGGVCAEGKEPLTSLYVCTISLPFSEGILSDSFRLPNGDEPQYGAGVFQKSIQITRLFLPLIHR